MSTTKEITACPACGRHSLVVHCFSLACNWHRCRNTWCDLVADIVRGRGHRLPLVDGRRSRWVR